MRLNPVYIIFMVGMIPGLIACNPVKSALPPWGFVASAFAYLLALRLLADYLGRKLIAHRKNDTRH